MILICLSAIIIEMYQIKSQTGSNNVLGTLYLNIFYFMIVYCAFVSYYKF